MSVLLPGFAFSTTVLSALALYAGSAHCRLRGLRRWRGVGTWAGTALAVISLGLWIADLGGSAGVCVMLGTWMLALMAFPYAAAWANPVADSQAES